MADSVVTKDTVIGRRGAYDTPQTAGLLAGQELEAVSPCFIHTDGKVYMANRTAHKTADAGVALYCGGFTDRKVLVNQPVTLFGSGTEFHYSAASGMTVGANLYISDVDGKLTETESTVDVVTASGTPDTTVKMPLNRPVAVAKDDQTIVVL